MNYQSTNEQRGVVLFTDESQYAKKEVIKKQTFTNKSKNAKGNKPLKNKNQTYEKKVHQRSSMALKTGTSASVADRFPYESSISSVHFNTESLEEECKAAQLSRKRFHAEGNRAKEIITAFNSSAGRLLHCSW